MHLFLHPITFVAKMLKKGLKGFSADETIVLEALTSHNQEELRQIEEAFKDDLYFDIAKSTNQMADYLKDGLKSLKVKMLDSPTNQVFTYFNREYWYSIIHIPNYLI